MKGSQKAEEFGDFFATELGLAILESLILFIAFQGMVTQQAHPAYLIKTGGPNNGILLNGELHFFGSMNI